MTAIGVLRDVELMASVHARAFAKGWTADAFAGLIARSGAQAYGSEHGFILMQALGPIAQTQNEPEQAHQAEQYQGEILTLAVVPSMRRQGLAGQLIVTAQSAMGLAHILLEVSAANHAAQALYAKHGFRVIGRRKAYYLEADGSRVDALAMRGVFPVPI